LDKNSKNVVSFNVGRRTNKTLSRVLETLKLSEAKKNIYRQIEKLQISD
jgi:IS1 family transposase